MAKLKVLCLHGSRQDGEILSQRITSLARKLADVADLIFTDAPHELPLRPGDAVAMRTWWHHPSLDQPDHASTHAADEGGSPSALTPQERQRVVSDWNMSLHSLRAIWTAHGGFHAILGFSNGAAAAFLLACHVAGDGGGWPGAERLACVILASGYVPEPLECLLRPVTAVEPAPDEPGGDDEVPPPSCRLQAPLQVSSLHIYSGKDVAVTSSQSAALAAQFEPSRRQVLTHDMGHCVPQKAQHCQVVLDFLSWFELSAVPPGSPEPGTLAQGAAGVLPALLPAPEPGPDTGTALPSLDDITSPEQLEEAQALEAIFGAGFRLLSVQPLVRFIIHLADPSAPPDASPNAPASSRFALLVTLPPEYPSSGEVPSVALDGPVMRSDPLHAALAAQLAPIAQQEMEHTGAGCCYQLVEPAREWVDARLGPGFGVAAAGEASGDVPHPLGGEDLGGSDTPWWESEEEADGAAIRAATAAASHAHWSRFYQAQGDGAVPPSQDVGAPTAHGDADGSCGGCDDSGPGGRWDYVVGLVGKPSAGKSSLYNALTGVGLDAEGGAKVAAQPFTTIAPNIGRGFALVPDPTRACGLQPGDARPLHGYALSFRPAAAPPHYANVGPISRWLGQVPWGQQALWRRVPVVVKDVAGLVPGAYQGRGRGNAFLNDLCDADVLIHVVDASGCTDKEGQATQPGEGADPLDDIGWVREEIHRWVFANVKRKWGVVRRRPSRLPDLFTGYHVPRATVYEVLERAGLPPSMLASDQAAPLLCSWSEAQLHELVAAFLSTRFPILLALNKADEPTAEAHIRRVRQALPLEPAVPVSAACERWLAAAAAAGQITYEPGGPCASVAPGSGAVGEDVARRVQEVQRRVLDVFSSTGVLLAVTTAMALRVPKLVWPVSDVATCVALPSKSVASGVGVLLGAEDAKARAAEGTSPSVLRDVLLLKPGSTPADAFVALKKPPWQLLEGDFVRAECRVLQAGDGAAQHKVLKKEEPLAGATVLRVMSNKRHAWQR